MKRFRTRERRDRKARERDRERETERERQRDLKEPNDNMAPKEGENAPAEASGDAKKASGSG